MKRIFFAIFMLIFLIINATNFTRGYYPILSLDYDKSAADTVDSIMVIDQAADTDSIFLTFAPYKSITMTRDTSAGAGNDSIVITEIYLSGYPDTDTSLVKWTGTTNMQKLSNAINLSGECMLIKSSARLAGKVVANNDTIKMQLLCKIKTISKLSDWSDSIVILADTMSVSDTCYYDTLATAMRDKMMLADSVMWILKIFDTESETLAVDIGIEYGE